MFDKLKLRPFEFQSRGRTRLSETIIQNINRLHIFKKRPEKTLLGIALSKVLQINEITPL